MEDLLISTLESFGFPVFLQGSLGKEDAYPDDFFTWWERPSYDGAHYDNKAVSCVYEYNIYFYSNNPSHPYEYIKKAKKLLQSKNFILSGNGYGVTSDETTHTGRGIEAMFIEREVS